MTTMSALPIALRRRRAEVVEPDAHRKTRSRGVMTSLRARDRRRQQKARTCPVIAHQPMDGRFSDWVQCDDSDLAWLRVRRIDTETRLRARRARLRDDDHVSKGALCSRECVDDPNV
jgi:hypothetical protein